MTDNRGVDVVYDSIGKTTFDKGLNVLRPRGYMVLFGAASGPVPPVDPNVLMQRLVLPHSSESGALCGGTQRVGRRARRIFLA